MVAMPKVLGEVFVEDDVLYLYVAGKGKSHLFRYDQKSRGIVK